MMTYGAAVEENLFPRTLLYFFKDPNRVLYIIVIKCKVEVDAGAGVVGLGHTAGDETMAEGVGCWQTKERYNHG